MIELARRVRDYAERHELWSPGDRVLTGLSGGPDSVALARVLRQLREVCGLELYALHVNFGLRGRSSDSDESFCRRFCAQFDLDLQVHRVTERPAGNLQAWARNLRYAEFARRADRLGARIATAHHADDRAETLLLQLFRGGGTAALANMTPASGRTIRPLLFARKSELLAGLRDLGQPFRIDRSNLGSAYRRNLIRHRLMPQLDEIFEVDACGVLSAEAEMLAAVSAYLQEQLDACGLSSRPTNGGWRILLQELRRVHPALQMLFLRGEVTARGHAVSRHQALRLHELISARPGTRVILADDLTAERGRDAIWLFDAPVQLEPSSLEIPGAATLPDGSSVHVRHILQTTLHPDGRRQAHIRLPAHVRQMTLRPARPGDRMQPFGMRGTRLVFDLLSEARIPRHRREQTWVLTDGDQIYWLLGVRQAEPGRVRAGDAGVYEFTWKPTSTDRAPGKGSGNPHG